MKGILISILFLVSQILSATDYYVKNGGNNTLSGLDDANAWAHHPWMSSWTAAAKSLSAGDNVYMKCGSTWTTQIVVAQSGSEGNHITISSYSTGAKPKIYISGSLSGGIIHMVTKGYLTFNNLEIQGATSGSAANTMGIYITSNSHDVTITNCTIHEVYEGIYNLDNSWNITIGDITAVATATTSAYSNNIYNFYHGGIGLCGTNPADYISNNKIYYNYIHDCTMDNWTGTFSSYGIHFESSAPSVGVPNYVYAYYNNIQDILGWECLNIHNGKNVFFRYNYCTNWGFNAVELGDASRGVATVEYVYVEGNTFEQPTSGWHTGKENAFILSWPEYGAIVNHVYIRDNIFTYTSRPTSALFYAIHLHIGNSANNIEISGNEFTNGSTATGKGAIYFWGSSISAVTIDRNFFKQWPYAMTFYGTGLTGSLKIRENIVTKPVTGCVKFLSAMSSSCQVEVYNNVFLNNTSGNVFENAYGGGTITAKNNILGAASSSSLYYWYLGAGTYSIDYNMYWNSSSTSPFYTGGGARTFTVWQSTYGHDAHGYNATNPSFVNAGGSYLLDTDFQIPTGSAAKDKGVGVGLSLDYFGNAIGASPDIGVHEFAGTPEPDEYPTVVTGGVTYIPYTSASSGGNVTDEGTASVTARGVCWATAINPTVADDKTQMEQDLDYIHHLLPD